MIARNSDTVSPREVVAEQPLHRAAHGTDRDPAGHLPFVGGEHTTGEPRFEREWGERCLRRDERYGDADDEQTEHRVEPVTRARRSKQRSEFSLRQVCERMHAESFRESVEGQPGFVETLTRARRTVSAPEK